MAKCSQCPNNAMYQVEGHLLCLHCYTKLKQVQNQELSHLSGQINYLSDLMDEMVGIPSYARVPIPQPVVDGRKITHNHINVDRSVIGTINTGTISNLNQTLENVSNNVDPDIAKLLSIFAETILKSNQMDDVSKEDLMEQLSFLSEQLEIEKSKQKKGMIRKAIDSINSTISNVPAILKLWEQIQLILAPLLS